MSRDNTGKKSPSTVWEFLNSSFGIFLLSSVALGLLSFSYNAWKDHISRNHKVEQLDIEIALRLQTMDQMCRGKDNVRYSNLKNVNSVMNGDTNVSFYVRRPIFNEFEHKNLTALLWQLYLLVPDSEKTGIKEAIRQSTELSEAIRTVRYEITQDDKQEQDILKRDYGQSDIYKRVGTLSKIERWHAKVI